MTNRSVLLTCQEQRLSLKPYSPPPLLTEYTVCVLTVTLLSKFL